MTIFNNNETNDDMDEFEEVNETPDFFEERDILGLPKLKLKNPDVLPDTNQEPKIYGKIEVEFAGLGSRFIAYFLDVIILLIPLYILGGVIFGLNNEHSLLRIMFKLIIWTLYYGFTESSDGQATFGKRICGIKVIDEHGNKLTFKKAALRYLAQIISILPLGFGIWAIAKDENKQAWHDVLVGCYVIVDSKPSQNLEEDK